MAKIGVILDVWQPSLQKCVIMILAKYVATPTMSASVWYILVCGLEGDEVLLETPEHGPFLH